MTINALNQRYTIRSIALGMTVLALLVSSKAYGQDTNAQHASQAMRKAAQYFQETHSVHGGYVYHYTLERGERWGEGLATDTQIWIQPPGTPTVGLAWVAAFEATGEDYYLDLATKAATAVAYGQLQSGGWTNSVDFNPRGRTAAYRNRKGKGKNNSSLDDGQTQSALRLLIAVDRLHKFQHKGIHEAASIGLKALLAAQFDNGAFPQVWTHPVAAKQPIIRASYPKHDWRSEGRIKNYWDQYTLNDNVAGYVATTLEEAFHTYRNPVYLNALRKLGDFLLLSQMPEPQPGWAQQYNMQMQPILARRFEPAAMASDETQEALDTLMDIYEATGDEKYLAPHKTAIAWLKRSRLKDGRFARYYELQNNRPLYMTRQGKTYTLTNDDSNLPSHYGWKIESRIDSLERRHAALVQGKTRRPKIVTEAQAAAIIRQLDSEGRWVTKHDGRSLVGQPKIRVGALYVSSQVFSDNLKLLAKYVEQNERR